MLKWSNRSWCTGLLTGLDKVQGANITTQCTGEATHPNNIQSQHKPLDAEGLNHRSFFVKTATVSFFFPFQKEWQASPSLDRQAWTITISTEKKRKEKNFFVGLPQLFSELP